MSTDKNMAKSNKNNAALEAKKREQARERKRLSRARIQADPQRHEASKEKERQR